VNGVWITACLFSPLQKNKKKKKRCKRGAWSPTCAPLGNRGTRCPTEQGVPADTKIPLRRSPYSLHPKHFPLQVLIKKQPQRGISQAIFFHKNLSYNILLFQNTHFKHHSTSPFSLSFIISFAVIYISALIHQNNHRKWIKN
jgi:hypothetical protein